MEGEGDRVDESMPEKEVNWMSRSKEMSEKCFSVDR